MPEISSHSQTKLIKTGSCTIKAGPTKHLFLVSVFSLILFFLMSFSAIYGWPAQAAAISPSVEKAETQWYLITLGGQKIGYIKETGQKIKENGQWFFKSYGESKMTFNRLGKKAEIVSNSEYLETEDGQLKKVVAEMVMSSAPVRVEALVEEGKVIIKTTAGGRTFTRELPFAGQLLGPEGISQLTQASLKQPGDKIEYKTLLAEISQVVTSERWWVGEEEIDFRGEKIKTRKIEEKTSGLGSTRQVWINEAGHEIKSIESSPFGDMIVIASNEEEVLKGIQGLTINEDQFQASLIKANWRLPQARDCRQLVIEVQTRKPELGWPDLNHDYQKVISQTAETTILAINQVNLKSPSAQKLSTEELECYLQANAYLGADHPEIKKVAREVAGQVKDPYEQALRLRNWVTTNMTFDLGIVFAPASEIIKNKRGTCAGYAALLASLLRAADIPSRYLMGLVYVNGIWGGHAWVEAWLSGRWVPLDAA
ncbi:MAG: transglutaminase-like domain-containing protein, partial [Acidobacteriota bacterium]|nr:transglutaminase-like domain-containing protein [Acidobacteriota bacterium]